MIHPAGRESQPAVAHARRTIAVATACTLFGCLSPGKPPVGQHVLAERSLTDVFLSPSETDGEPSHLLVTGPLQEPVSTNLHTIVADLYAIPIPAPPNPLASSTAIPPVVQRFVANDSDPLHGVLATDSLGRLLVLQEQPTEIDVLRVDLTAGTQNPLESAFTFMATSVSNLLFLSPARTRACVYDVFDLAGGPWRIGDSCSHVAFVGEDLYYAYSDVYLRPGYVCGLVAGVCRLGPNGVSQLVFTSSKVSAVWPVPSLDARELLISESPTAGQTTFSLLDTDTLISRALPAETTGASYASTSPSGNWLLFWTSNYTLVLYNRTTGAVESVDSAVPGASYSEWRPAHDELWFHTLAGGFSIWKPGWSVTTVHASLSNIAQSSGTKESAFTQDGRHWFASGEGGGTVVYVGSADDPGSAIFPINSPGANLIARSQISDGRLVVQTRAITDYRLPTDISLVDPDTGDSRVMCGGCKLVALGGGRALLLLNWSIAQETGDLALVNLTTFERTVLGQSAYAVAVDRGKSADVPPGTDALAPGTRLAFLVRNRLMAPHDGLWVARLP